MTSLQDRERVEEAKFARDEDLEFRIQARRNRLLAHWAAERMGLSATESESYAQEVVQADFEEAGDEDVVRKLICDMIMAGVEVQEAQVRAALAEKQTEARRMLHDDT